MVPRLKTRFEKEILPKFGQEFSIQNRMAMPRVSKVVINVGMGKELEGTKVKPHVREQVLDDLAVISGQKPVLVRAKKAVSNFKVRDGYLTHAMVTLRGARMWEFLDRLINIAVPRVRDFRGLNDRSFDKQGNYSIGVTEQAIFPEINMAEAKYNHGMNINIVFTNSDPQRSRFVLAELGVPFRKPNEK